MQRIRSDGVVVGPGMSIGSSATKIRPSGAASTTEGHCTWGGFPITSIFQSLGALSPSGPSSARALAMHQQDTTRPRPSATFSCVILISISEVIRGVSRSPLLHLYRDCYLMLLN